MKKRPFILLINGSPRKKGKTSFYLERIKKGIQKEKGDFSILHLVDFEISPCRGCYSQNPRLCTFPCRIKDDMEKIYPLILKAQALVLGAPSFWFSIPGQVKNFIDRLTALENNGDLLEGKIFAAVSSAEESGGEEVSHYLISTFNEMGCLIPPFATPFFNEKGGGSWKEKDLEILGQNIVRLAKALEKAKLL